MTIKITGSFPTAVWDAQASQQLGLIVANLIKERTSEGRGENDGAMKPYSTNPMKIYHRTTRRLSQGVTRPKMPPPLGGTPFPWVKGPRKVDGTYDETKIGQEGGRFYAGGYAQYKRAARKGLTSKSGKTGAEVDLTLSGQMLRQFGIIRHSRYSVTIGLKGQSREYGSFVDRARPWIAVSPENAREVELVLPGIVAGAQKRAGGGNGAT
jgi:hypothetical protein